MKITVLTLFPEIINGYFTNSIMAKAVDRGLIDYSVVDFRSYAQDKHKTCDDSPYGGGAGMVLKPEPIASALKNVTGDGTVVYMSASGIPLSQERAFALSRNDSLVFLCGRYEGVDQRIIDRYVDIEISIGDYVLSSGEVAALVCIDSIYRLLDGVINNESLEEESFQNGLLEYPHYTRPEQFEGMGVPEVLLSGHHEKIAEWRRFKSIEKTEKNRPDLLERALNNKEFEQEYKKYCRTKENNDGFSKDNRIGTDSGK